MKTTRRGFLKMPGAFNIFKRVRFTPNRDIVGAFNDPKTGVAKLVHVSDDYAGRFSDPTLAAVLEIQRVANGAQFSILSRDAIPANRYDRDKWIVDHEKQRIVTP